MPFDGNAAIANPAFSDVTATTSEWSVDDAGIDRFELEASRRILANLRQLLYERPMWDLIEKQVDVADRQFQRWFAESNGEYKGGEVKLRIRGISTEQLFEAIMQTLGAAMLQGDVRRDGVFGGVFPAHPEHYGLAVTGPGGVETMGGMPTLTFPAYVADDEIPEFIAPLVDREYYDLSRVGRGLLRDGSVQSYVLQQFKDVDGGVEASLYIWFPAACPDSVFREHLQHYSVEFRNGVRMANALIAQVAAEPEEELELPESATGEADTGVDGTWHVEGSMGPAKREFDVTIATDGNSATGSISAADGRTKELTGGKVAGGTVVFKVNLGMKLTFTLEIDGDVATGSMKAGIMPATRLTGRRVA